MAHPKQPPSPDVKKIAPLLKPADPDGLLDAGDVAIRYERGVCMMDGFGFVSFACFSSTNFNNKTDDQEVGLCSVEQLSNHNSEL